MNEKDKTILLVVLAALAMCGCLIMSCCAASVLVLSRVDRSTIQEVFSGETEISSGTENTGNVVSFEVLDDGSEELSQAERLIIAETEKVRGLKAEEPLAPVYQTEDELREYMISQLDDVSDEDFKNELGLYTILGFAPKDFDLRQFYVDLYTEQIAGFYDPEENQMYLIEDISPYENALTLAHEYTHYLQYNTPEFEKTLVYDDSYCDDHGEECMIINSIIEGDASLTEGLIEPEKIIGSYNQGVTESEPSSSVFDNSPRFFQDSLIFPYLYGYDFVAYHYLKGGFDAVNDLYINLPQSVEQILHPEKYLTDLPVDVTLEPFRSIITKEFDIIQEDVLNESDIMMILSCGYDESWQLSDRQASVGADGWGGGAFLFAEKDDQPMFFSKIVWDDENEAKEAETLFAIYLDKRFGESDDNKIWKTEDQSASYLIRQNDVLYWMILPGNFDSENMINLLENGSIL